MAPASIVEASGTTGRLFALVGVDSCGECSSEQGGLGRLAHADRVPGVPPVPGQRLANAEMPLAHRKLVAAEMEGMTVRAVPSAGLTRLRLALETDNPDGWIDLPLRAASLTGDGMEQDGLSLPGSSLVRFHRDRLPLRSPSRRPQPAAAPDRAAQGRASRGSGSDAPLRRLDREGHALSPPRPQSVFFNWGYSPPPSP